MYKIIGWFLQPEPRGGISVCYRTALLGMDAVRVAWPGAVCSFVRDACTRIDGIVLNLVKSPK